VKVINSKNIVSLAVYIKHNSLDLYSVQQHPLSCNTFKFKKEFELI